MKKKKTEVDGKGEEFKTATLPLYYSAGIPGTFERFKIEMTSYIINRVTKMKTAGRGG